MNSVGEAKNWQQHRKRWFDRITRAERKAAHLEFEIHNVLDDIDEGKATIEEIHRRLIRAVEYANTTG